MFRRLWVSLRRDNLINWRNYFYFVTIVVALAYLAAAKFAIPADTTLQPDVYVVDATSSGRFAAFIEQETAAPGATANAHLVDSEEALRQRMRDNRNSVGLKVVDGSPLPQATLYFQGHENAKVRNLLAVATAEELRLIYGAAQPSQVSIAQQTLRSAATAVRPPFNEAVVPFLIFSDAVMIGLMFIAALVFMEKEEGTLKAYLVTPGRVGEYLLSKALTLAFLAVLFTLILVPPVLGGGPNYLHLLAMVALGSIFASLLGAWAAVYFENFSQFLFPTVLLLAAISLPGIAYWVPSFSPLWLQWLPTYPLVFGLREAAFPSGSPHTVYSALLVLLAVDAVLLAISSLAFTRQTARA